MVLAGTTGFSTYDLEIGVKLDFEDVIYLLDPFDVPLQTAVDGGGRSVLSGGPITQKKYEWSDEELLIQRSTLDGAILNTATELDVAAGDGIKFAKGDILLIDAEFFRVTAVSTDTLTVTGGYAGSARAGHSDAEVIVCVGQALPEGSEPEEARAIDRTGRYNMSQIFGPWAVHTTGTEDVIDKYGLTGSEFDHQVANRMKEMAVSMEQAILYGERFDDETNKWRTFGGLKYWMTSNVHSTAEALTETILLDQLQACFDNGGNPDRIVVGSKQKRVISGFNSTLIRYDRADESRGQIVENYDSDFGRQAVVLDRWVRKEDLFIFAREQAEITTLRPMQFEMLAKTGDSTKGQVLMERGFKFYKASHAARCSALT